MGFKGVLLRIVSAVADRGARNKERAFSAILGPHRSYGRMDNLMMKYVAIVAFDAGSSTLRQLLQSNVISVIHSLSTSPDGGSTSHRPNQLTRTKLGAMIPSGFKTQKGGKGTAARLVREWCLSHVRLLAGMRHCRYFRPGAHGVCPRRKPKGHGAVPFAVLNTRLLAVVAGMSAFKSRKGNGYA